MKSSSYHLKLLDNKSKAQKICQTQVEPINLRKNPLNYRHFIEVFANVGLKIQNIMVFVINA